MRHPLIAVLALPALVACGDVQPKVTDAGHADDFDAAAAIDSGPDSAPVDAAPADAAPTDAAGPRRIAQKLVAVRDLDILFVVDNSGSMAEEQASLAANFQRFMNALRAIEGGTPNLHIGVVSTDVGAGPFNISGCTGNGDNGVLQSAPQGACTPPEGAFISDIADGTGGRITNYTGTLEDSFSCIARLGIDGCGFEQPLESMRRALNGSNAANAGFLRESAALAVIIISDEDDCSAADTSVFDTSHTSVSDPLGPLSSFRCFEFGVRCNPDDPRTPGPRTSCTPRQPSPYMYDVTTYADFLRGLKADPDLIMVAMIAGNPTPVTVETNDQANPELSPSCVSAAGEADPAVRLSAFAGMFPGRNTQQTICNDDLSDALILTANSLGTGIGGRCLLAAPLDLEPGTAGLQHDCRVADVTDFGTPQENTVQQIPECTGTTTGPCFTLRTSSNECTGTDVQIDRRGTTRPPGTVPGIWCTAE